MGRNSQERQCKLQAKWLKCPISHIRSIAKSRVEDTEHIWAKLMPHRSPRKLLARRSTLSWNHGADLPGRQVVLVGQVSPQVPHCAVSLAADRAARVARVHVPMAHQRIRGQVPAATDLAAIWCICR